MPHNELMENGSDRHKMGELHGPLNEKIDSALIPGSNDDHESSTWSVEYHLGLENGSVQNT